MNADEDADGQSISETSRRLLPLFFSLIVSGWATLVGRVAMIVVVPFVGGLRQRQTIKRTASPTRCRVMGHYR